MNSRTGASRLRTSFGRVSGSRSAADVKSNTIFRDGLILPTPDYLAPLVKPRTSAQALTSHKVHKQYVALLLARDLQNPKNSQTLAIRFCLTSFFFYSCLVPRPRASARPKA
eukprot:1187085-Prorocentrum_minimum.AAC.3